MKRILLASLLAGLVATVAMISTFAQAAEEKKGKAQSIKEIMKCAFEEDTGCMDVISSMVTEKEPKWDVIQGKSKEWVKAAADLGKNKPKKGSAESWEKLSKKWYVDVKALDAATDKKDVKATAAALKTIEGSCKGCHPAHKGKE